MTDQILPHQLTAVDFLKCRGPALLWDEMGLGKSLSAIAAADAAGCAKILVCCPAAVKPHWAREFARWQKLDRSITIVEGNPKTPPGDGVTIVSHAAFANEQATAIIKQGAPYALIIFDEVHQFREYSARRTRLAVGLADAAWRWSFRFWGLSGTPVVNSAADLWPMLAGPFYHLQSWGDFAAQFTNTKADGITPTGIKNTSQLADILRPYVLRRTMASIGIDLPPMTIEEFEIEINIAALRDITAELADWTPARVAGLLERDGDINDGNLSRVRHMLGLAKAAPTAQYIDWLMSEGAGPIVVFFHHTDVREQLYRQFSQLGYCVSWIDGKVTPSQLTAAEAAFQAGEIDILLAQTQAAGQGLTLHRANTCVQAELPWTSVALDQANARILRIGQTRPCTAHVLRARGCWLEDVMASIVSGKRKAADNLLNLLTTDD